MLPALYKPRDPRASDLWRLIDEHFDAFQQVYDERFQAKYGFWRPVIERSVAAFFKCGDLEEGFARVRCPDCKHEMFVAFSCKQPTIAARRCPLAHPATRSVDPLFAKGFVLLGAGPPIVMIALDWCQCNNDSYDRWREVLARAAGTTPERVMLATVHQHDAPICDLTAQKLLDEYGLKGTHCDPEFHEKAVQRTADALNKALASCCRVTHFGIGQAKVEKVASNRRVVTPGGKIHWGRGSASGDMHGAPEGEIDPWLKAISFFDGNRPVLTWRQRVEAGHAIDVPCLDLGGGIAQFLIMPAESFVGYQLIAQQLRPDSFVMVAGFGDSAAGYIPTNQCWKDGYNDNYCWVPAMTEKLMTEAMAKAPKTETNLRNSR